MFNGLLYTLSISFSNALLYALTQKFFHYYQVIIMQNQKMIFLLQLQALLPKIISSSSNDNVFAFWYNAMPQKMNPANVRHAIFWLKLWFS